MSLDGSPEVVFMFPKETKILIVDDMNVMRRLVSSLLQELGFLSVVEAFDGGDAWNKLQKAASSGSPFQLVISDWNMPRLMGIDLLRRLRQSEVYSQIPFIMLTAENDQESVRESAEAGVTCHLAKPFQIDDLREQLRIAYEKCQQQGSNRSAS